MELWAETSSVFNIKKCQIKDNHSSGIRILRQGGQMNVKDSQIEGNLSFGIQIDLLADCNLNINNCNIDGNEKKQLYNNSKSDIQATENWWGDTDELTIRASIYDFWNDSAKGKVMIRPFLTEPIPFPGTECLPGHKGSVGAEFSSDGDGGGGRLFVEVTPRNARIRILNIGPPFKQGIKLEPGEYHIEASAKGYETNEEWITLDDMNDKTHQVHLKKR